MTEQEKLYRNGLKVDSLYRAIRDSQAIELIPQLVRQVIADEMWRGHYYEKTGETFRFDSIRQFIETHPPDGLGTTINNLFKMCTDEPEVMDMLDLALQQDTNITSDENEKPKRPPISSARQAGLRKLRLLSEQNEAIASLRRSVLAGELSLNAALVSAGLKKKRISMTKDVSRASESLKRNFSTEEVQQLIDLLK
jgi:hypothetical protein